MTNLSPQQDQIVTRLFLTDMSGEMAKVQARQELSSFALQSVIFSWLPPRKSEAAFLGLVMYRWHIGFSISKIQSSIRTVQ
jgi:hypothetical protein